SSILYGLTHLANHPHDLGSPLPYGFMALGVIFLAAFARHELKAADPMINVRLFAWRPFVASSAQQLMWTGCFQAFFNFIPFYASIAFGMSATASGAILTPRSIVAVVFSFVGTVALMSRGYRLPWLAGIYLLALSMFLVGTGVGEVNILGVHISEF